MNKSKESFIKVTKQPEKRYSVRYTDRTQRYDSRLNMVVSA